jgi:hypothetical protein
VQCLVSVTKDVGTTVEHVVCITRNSLVSAAAVAIIAVHYDVCVHSVMCVSHV